MKEQAKERLAVAESERLQNPNVLHLQALSISETPEQPEPFPSLNSKPPTGRDGSRIAPVSTRTAAAIPIADVGVVLEHLAQSDEEEVKATRVVMNHSTHADGVLQFINLLKEEPCIKTIIPGPLENRKNHVETFTVRVQRKEPETVREENTLKYKLVARKGTQVQDLYVVCASGTSQSDLDSVVLRLLCEGAEEAAGSKERYGTLSFSDIGLAEALGPNSNFAIAEKAANAWRSKHQEQHKKIKEKEKSRAADQKVAAQMRKLKALKAGGEGVDMEALAKHDTEILEGTVCGKHAMR
uniref:Uncharacterized protein n=1 Tax=Chromera velia CCMP2878 TaxID=1169474 RepID=A0A0G4GMC6_9ALVE|eukprot:Cvel_22512.t1-p1 / transcript=Cvel_22512.t1 / gene=Cvel_22512 / organism=Chromera_velia_CCMP2878 / gene_product=hypothetical protein / transcript_product=hypothetical protein / location=Cvel_scaffold2220:2800-4238(-) / protein_length=297 / sequence_SO=supercontig / SO=protein_coding / is_pseudo=false